MLFVDFDPLSHFYFSFFLSLFYSPLPSFFLNFSFPTDLFLNLPLNWIDILTEPLIKWFITTHNSMICSITYKHSAFILSGIWPHIKLSYLAAYSVSGQHYGTIICTLHIHKHYIDNLHFIFSAFSALFKTIDFVFFFKKVAY